MYLIRNSYVPNALVSLLFSESTYGDTRQGFEVGLGLKRALHAAERL